LHPEKKQTPPKADGKKHYLYHRNLNQTTKKCADLREKIEELMQARNLK